jgi:hypothetical protein
MNRFSVTRLEERAKLYTCSCEVLDNVILRYTMLDFSRDVLGFTRLGEEVTFYVYGKEGDARREGLHLLLSRVCTSDPRWYVVLDIHEDLPGIDHVGIIHRIAGCFLPRAIPILYVNTYGHNLVFVAEEHSESAWEALQDMALLSP